MAHIPTQVKNLGIIPGLHLLIQGKVRDIYAVPGRPDLQLMVASDRLSTNDVVLSRTVPKKGVTLTALTYFWMVDQFSEVPNHLVYHPDGPEAGNYVRLLSSHYPQVPVSRSMVVKKLKMIPYEFVYRYHIGGSVWREYKYSGKVGGQDIPKGLHKWAKLDEPVFTPARKAASGHDENITVEQFLSETGDDGHEMMRMGKYVYEQAYRAARAQGVIILDTKFELGRDESGKLYLADEILTPDSSRFTLEDALPAPWEGDKDPPFWDKQPVRDYAKTIETPFYDEVGRPITGLAGLSPNNPEHLKFVDSLSWPDQVINNTTERFVDIATRLMGREPI